MRTADDFKKDLRLIISNSSQSGIEFFDTAAAASLRVGLLHQDTGTLLHGFAVDLPWKCLQPLFGENDQTNYLTNGTKNHGKKYRTCCVIAVVAQVEQSSNVTPYGCVRALVAALRSCYSLLSNYTNIYIK
ncbi:hypothetical protein HAX54_044020 [Datura stramonium]|uniref:Uncharacterized protein n=1 Tax=Datura stramonium TaxID=4076 RepID=A0ABS8W391_DATST|nr:hypothetical protein [Datura stramonium]